MHWGMENMAVQKLREGVDTQILQFPPWESPTPQEPQVVSQGPLGISQTQLSLKPATD